MSYKLVYQNYSTASVGTFNSLADGALTTMASTSTSSKMMMDVAVTIAAQAGARSADAALHLYASPTGNASGDRQLLAVVGLDASTNARTVVLYGLPAPPSTFAVGVFNSTGQATAASGNSVSIGYYEVTSVV